MRDFDGRFYHAVVVNRSHEKPTRTRAVLEPKCEGRVSWQEHNLCSSDGVTLVDAYRGREIGAAVVGKSQLYGRLVLRPCEPSDDRAPLIGVQMRTVHGTSREMPVVRVDNVGLRPTTFVVSQQ